MAGAANQMKRKRLSRVVVTCLCLMVAACASPSAGPASPERRAPTVSGEFTFDQPLRATIDSVIWTDAGYVAIGSGYLPWVDEEALQVWQSGDGFEWAQIHLAELECCLRDERSVELVDSPHGLLAITSGLLLTSPGGNWYPASFLRSSNDGGRTWAEHSGGPWNVRGTAAVRPQIVGSTVLVTAVTHSTSITEVGPMTPSMWRSDDLDTWEEIRLPDGVDDGWVQFSAVDEQTYLVMTIDQSTYEHTWYLSKDRGMTFAPVPPPHPEHPAHIVGAVGGRFVVTLDPARDEWEREDDARRGPVIATSRDGRNWDIEERNNGLWGDGQPRLDTQVLVDGVLHVPFGRTMRHDIRYCIADPSACRQFEQAIAVIDGQHQTRELLVDMSAVEPPWDLRFVRSPRTLLVWHADWDPSSHFSVQAHRWDDLGPDDLHQPEPLAPPVQLPHPVLRLHQDPIPVGQRFYTRLPIGSACNADRFQHDDRWYVLSDTWPHRDDIPASWPFQPYDGTHGPMGFLFVEGKRSDLDTFRFFIARDTTVEYHHDLDGEPQFRC